MSHRERYLTPWFSAYVKVFASVNGKMRAASKALPLRLRIGNDAIELDRNVSLPITTTGFNAELRFFAKGSAPIITMPVDHNWVSAGNIVEVTR